MRQHSPRRTDRKHQIVSPGFLNPFVVHVAACITILFLYSLSWSDLYSPLNSTLIVFLLGTICIGAVFGIVVHRRIMTIAADSDVGAVSPSGWRITLAIVALHLIQFILVGNIPFFIVGVGGNSSSYGTFEQVPIVGVLLTTFSIFFSIRLTDKWHSTSVLRFRAHLILQFVLIQAMFVLLLNRGAIGFTLLASGLLMLSKSRVTLRGATVAICIALSALFAFGALGNFRESGTFSDSSHIVRLAHLSSVYPDAIPHEFVWGYIYTVSPLGNLNAIVTHVQPTSDFASTATDMLPDFVTKRLFPEFDATAPQVVPYFNVSTGYATAWKFNGFVGLWITFGTLTLLLMIATLASTRNWLPITLALAGALAIFMFFADAISYSGISFSLIYPVLASNLAMGRRRRKQRAHPKTL